MAKVGFGRSRLRFLVFISLKFAHIGFLPCDHSIPLAWSIWGIKAIYMLLHFDVIIHIVCLIGLLAWDHIGPCRVGFLGWPRWAIYLLINLFKKANRRIFIQLVASERSSQKDIPVIGYTNLEISKIPNALRMVLHWMLTTYRKSHNDRHPKPPRISLS